MKCIHTLLFVYAFAAAGAPAAEPAAHSRPAEPPAREQIERWVADLDSPSFSAREQATRRLIDAGHAAAQPLVAATQEASLERTSRTLEVLTSLCTHGNVEAQAAAASALDTLAHAADDRLARRARAALESARADRRRSTIARIEALGGRVERDDDDPLGEATGVRFGRFWRGGDNGVELLRSLHGIHWVSFEGSGSTDAVLEYLVGLEELEKVYLGPSRITGAGLSRLKQLPQLQHVSLRGLTLSDAAWDDVGQLTQIDSLGLDQTNISNQRLQKITHLEGLKTLWLNKTAVGDDGLVHLSKLKNLNRLELANTQVRGPGLAELKPLAKLEFMTLEASQLDDEGARHAAELKQLKSLGLDHTPITDAGLLALEPLGDSLEVLWIGNTKVTAEGLLQLSRFKKLSRLHLEGMQLSDGAIEKVREAVPHLQVLR